MYHFDKFQKGLPSLFEKRPVGSNICSFPRCTKIGTVLAHMAHVVVSIWKVFLRHKHPAPPTIIDDLLVHEIMLRFSNLGVRRSESNSQFPIKVSMTSKRMRAAYMEHCRHMILSRGPKPSNDLLAIWPHKLRGLDMVQYAPQLVGNIACVLQVVLENLPLTFCG